MHVSRRNERVTHIRCAVMPFVCFNIAQILAMTETSAVSFLASLLNIGDGCRAGDIRIAPGIRISPAFVF